MHVSGTAPLTVTVGASGGVGRDSGASDIQYAAGTIASAADGVQRAAGCEACSR